MYLTKYDGFLIYNVSLPYIAFIIFTLWLIDYKIKFFFSYFVLFKIQYLTTKMFVTYRLLVVFLLRKNFEKYFTCGYSFVSQKLWIYEQFWISHLSPVCSLRLRKKIYRYCIDHYWKKTIYYCAFKVLCKGSASNGIPSAKSRVKKIGQDFWEQQWINMKWKKLLYERTEWK